MSGRNWVIATQLYNEYGTLLQQTNQIDVLAEETQKYRMILEQLWSVVGSSGDEKEEQMAVAIRNLIDKYGEYGYGLDPSAAREYAHWMIDHPVFAAAAFEQAMNLTKQSDFKKLIQSEIPYYEGLASYKIKNLRERLKKMKKAWWEFWK